MKIRDIWKEFISKETWNKVAELATFDHMKWKVLNSKTFPREYVLPLIITIAISLISVIFALVLVIWTMPDKK